MITPLTLPRIKGNKFQFDPNNSKSLYDLITLGDLTWTIENNKLKSVGHTLESLLCANIPATKNAKVSAIFNRSGGTEGWGMALRAQASDTYYLFQPAIGNAGFNILRAVSGVYTTLGSSNTPIPNNSKLTYYIIGSQISVEINDKLVFIINDNSIVGTGKFGLRNYGDSGVYFERLEVESL